MSRTLARMIEGLARILTAPLRPARRSMALALASERMVQRASVPVPGAAALVFECPSARALHDPIGFGVDEPETVAWIDSLPAGETFWDIGANIGVYSLYAAARRLDVWAFEPSAASFGALTRNIEINGMGDQVRAYCLAFDAASAKAELHMAATAAGHSMHGIGGVSVAGPVPATFRQAVLCYSVDHLRDLFGLPAPLHVKLDVDGLEPAILDGASRTLRGVQTLLVEILDTDATRAGTRIRAALAAAGLQEQPASPGARNVLFRRPP